MTIQPLVDFASPTRSASLPPPSYRRFARSQQERSATEAVATRDHRVLQLRPIEPGDVAALRRCFTRLPAEDIRRRFMHMLTELPEPMAQRLCRVDEASEAAFVLADETVTPAELRGVGRIFIDEATDSAEFSVLVERDWITPETKRAPEAFAPAPLGRSCDRSKLKLRAAQPLPGR